MKVVKVWNPQGMTNSPVSLKRYVSANLDSNLNKYLGFFIKFAMIKEALKLLTKELM